MNGFEPASTGVSGTVATASPSGQALSVGSSAREDESGAPSPSCDLDQATELYRQFLESLGVDTTQASLVDTPRRVATMLHDLLTPADFAPTSFENDGSYDSLVVLKGIPFYSLCEHHVVPFYGVAHVGYLPNERVIGLSKLARFVERHARALQVQERMTASIATDVAAATETDTVGVIIDARHLCVEMRGVKKPGAVTRTSTMRGSLRTNPSLKSEFMDAISGTSGHAV